MGNNTQYSRRNFLGLSTLAFAATQIMPSRALANGNTRSLSGATVHTFAEIKQIEAGVLNIGYAETGPANGQAVILLHGWPYDIHSYAESAALLAEAGYRVIVPHLRGHG